ncbi:uncharacterized protein [Leptinotarsa decemlineata]|uniref:uncharacterized protein n=1 Tax=Leptinotarsa decemlineata TaxID=7539 RepID=UPI003D304C31
MSVRGLKAVLTILAEKSEVTSEQFENNEVAESLFLLPQEEFYKDIDIDRLKTGIDKLVILKKELLNHPEYKYVQLIYKVLLLVFSNTTQKERQYDLEDLLDHFHDALREKLLKSTDSVPIMSKLAYHKLIRKCLPLIKLELVQKLLKKYLAAKVQYSSGLKIAIGELYECVCFTRILREECYVIAKKKLGTSDFDLKKIDLLDMDERGGSLGSYAKLKIFVEHAGKPTVLQFFAKFVLEQGEVLRMMSEGGFKKEVFMYTVFVPLLKDMGLENLVDFLPVCYLVRPDEMILLDDLSYKGYSSLDVSNSFHHDHLLKSITPLAKLHATSLVFEKKLSDFLETTTTIDEYYKEYLEEIFYMTGNGFESLVQCFVKYFLEKFPDIPKKLTAEVIKEKIDVQINKWFNAVKNSEYPKVLCHGDTWCNNIMFQHDGREKTDKCYFVDYQLTRYCPPAFEILGFIYCTTDKKTRSKYKEYVLESYYNELETHLKEHEVKIENIYPFDTFMKSCESIKLFSIFHALVYLHYILIPKDILEKMKRDKKLMEKLMSDDRRKLLEVCWDHMPFRMRLKELIEEICEICEDM